MKKVPVIAALGPAHSQCGNCLSSPHLREACIPIKLLCRTRVALTTESYQGLVFDMHVRHGEVVLWGFSGCGKESLHRDL